MNMLTINYKQHLLSIIVINIKYHSVTCYLNLLNISNNNINYKLKEINIL